MSLGHILLLNTASFLFSGSDLQRSDKDDPIVPWSGFSDDPRWKYLEEFFVRRVKKGIIPSPAQLKNALKKKFPDVPVTAKDYRDIARFRRRWKALAAFSNIGPPKRYMNFVLFRLGNIFVDIAFMPDKLAWHNDRNKCIFVACEAGSQLVFAEPMPSKASASLYGAIRKMCDVAPFEAAHTIWSDREAAIVSRNFQREILLEYGIRFQFLHFRHKAFFAERAIRTIKEKLFALMKLTGRKDWSGELLRNVVLHYNREKAHGTSFRRVDIGSRNYKDFLSEYLEVPGPEDVLGSSEIGRAGLGGTKKDFSKVWKHPINAAVLLYRGGYSETSEKKPLYKASAHGRAGSRVFYVHRHVLKSSNQLSLVPVYQLRTTKDFNGDKSKIKRGYFYNRELVSLEEPLKK